MKEEKALPLINKRFGPAALILWLFCSLILFLFLLGCTLKVEKRIFPESRKSKSVYLWFTSPPYLVGCWRAELYGYNNGEYRMVLIERSDYLKCGRIQKPRGPI